MKRFIINDLTLEEMSAVTTATTYVIMNRENIEGMDEEIYNATLSALHKLWKPLVIDEAKSLS